MRFTKFLPLLFLSTAIYSGNSIDMVGDRIKQAYSAQEVGVNEKEKLESEKVDSGVHNEWLQRKSLFDLYSSVLTQDTNNLSPQCADDIQFFCGATDHPENSLLSHMKHQQTCFGEGFVAYRLANPFTTLNEILSSQKLVQDLTYGDLPYLKIRESLGRVAQAQPMAFSYFQGFSETAQKSADLVFFKNRFLKPLNKSSLALEATTRIKEGFQAAISFLPTILTTGALVSLQNALKEEGLTMKDLDLPDSYLGMIKKALGVQFTVMTTPLQPTHIKHGVWALRNYDSNPKVHSDALINSWKGTPIETALKRGLAECPDFAEAEMLDAHKALSIGQFPYMMLISGVCWWNLYKSGSEIKTTSDITFALHKKVMGFATICREAEALKKLIGDRIPFPTLSPAAQNIYNLMQKNTFANASRFAFLGRVLMVHQLLLEHKEEFGPLFAWIGEVDAYTGIATLVKEDNAFAQYSFVDFTQNETPYFAASGFWNPFIEPTKVVKNDIILGDNAAHSNVIFTGPNAGGKSTTMKAIVTNLILAQSFGIAAADSCTMTPFTKIYSSMNTPDDIALGKSHFVAEVERAKQILKVAKETDGLCFFAIDELFTGTGHNKAASLAAKMLKELIENEQSMTFTATHYAELTDLEAITGRAVNMQVSPPKTNSDGKLVYPYTIEPGISTVNVADDIMENYEI